MKRYIYIILTMVITLITVTTLVWNGERKKTNFVNSNSTNKPKSNITGSGAGFIQDNYYDVNIKY